MSNYWDPSTYTLENQLSDMLGGRDVITCDDGSVIKGTESHVDIFGQAVLIVDTVMVGSTMTATETHQVDCIIGNYPFCSVEMHLLQVK